MLQPSQMLVKTPTTEAELATAVDGGQRVMCMDSMPGQGMHVIPPKPEARKIDSKI